MMERIITLKKISDINTYSTFDAYLVESVFSSYFQFVFEKEKLIESINEIHLLNKKIYLKADKILIEKEISLLTEYVDIFSLVDGVFFEDFAFVSFFEEKNIETDLIYYPFDAIGDKEDIKALLSFNIKRICVPVGKEYLLNDESLNAYLGYKAICIEPLFYTRRKILSLYDNVNGLRIDSKEYNLTEKTRTSIQKVIETDNGSMILLSDIHLYKQKQNVSFAIYDRTFIDDELFLSLLKEEDYE